MVLSSQFYKASSEYTIGIITSEVYETKLNKICLELLEIIKQAAIQIEKNRREKSRLISGRKIHFFYLFLMIFVGFSTIYFFRLTRNRGSVKNTSSELSSKKKSHQEGQIMVLIASFQSNTEDVFSSSLIAALRKELTDNNYYKVGNANFMFGSVDQINYRDSIERMYFKDNQKGVFASGLWKKEDKVFNCYIDLFNLKLTIPNWQTPETIILNNPTDFGLSIKNGTNFLASFILGIVKTYEGNIGEAIDLFDKLENSLIASEDQYVRSYILQYKGHCNTLLGNYETAKENYEIAKSIGPHKLKEVVAKNIQTLAYLKANVPEYVLKQVFTSILRNELPKDEEKWFNEQCESFDQYLSGHSNTETRRKLCATVITPLLYYRYRYRGNVIEVGDKTIDKEGFYDSNIGFEVAREITIRKIRSSNFYESTNESQMIKSILKIHKEVDQVLKNNVSFLGREINRNHPDAPEMLDIMKEENAEARQKLYQRKLKERNYAGNQ